MSAKCALSCASCECRWAYWRVLVVDMEVCCCAGGCEVEVADVVAAEEELRLVRLAVYAAMAVAEEVREWDW